MSVKQNAEPHSAVNGMTLNDGLFGCHPKKNATQNTLISGTVQYLMK
jgi:hypothetical protein